MANFDEMDIFSFFGMETPKEEPKEEAKVTPVATSNDDVDEVEGEDGEDMVEDTDDAPATKPAATSTKPKKGSSKSVMGKDTIKLPITVYGRNFTKTYDSLSTATYNGLAAQLYADGYKEVALCDTDFIPFDNRVLLKTPVCASSDTNAITFPTNGEVVVCDGLLQAPVTQAVIGKDADECSVGDLSEKFAEINPLYADCNICYSERVAVAAPVLTTVKSIKLPATVNVCGNRIDLTEEDFPSSNEITADKVFYQYVPIAEIKGAEFSFGKYSDGSYCISFAKGKATSVMCLDRASFEICKDAKQKKVEEKYVLPFELVATSSDQRLTATTEMFGGKEKVTQAEVLELLSKNNSQYDPQLIGFKIYAATDRQFNFVYGDANGNRKLVVSATSGKKG